MKNLHKFVIYSFIGGMVSLWSCQKKEELSITHQLMPVENLPGDKIPPAVSSQIIAAGFSADKAKITEGGYIVEGDIFLSQASLDEYQKTNKKPSKSGAVTQQWTTNNTVYAPAGQTTQIAIQLDSDLANSSLNGNTDYYARIGEATARYNSIGNPSLRIVLINTPSYASANPNGYVIHVHAAPSGSPYSGLSGFPANGAPFGDIYLNRGYLNYETPSTVTTIIAHEIGHCLGFRHTDYFNRSLSCYSGGAEPVSPDGANLVPGTGYDASSWMLACYSSGQDRPFTSSDVLSLRYLFGM